MRLFYITPFILQGLIWLPTRLALSVFGRLEIRGLHNLTKVHENVIFASNHTSELDVFVIASSVPFWSHFSPLCFVSRENKFYDTSGWRRHLYGGAIFKLWGAQPVHAGLHDYEKSLANHIYLLQDGKSVLLFPEGHITTDGSVQSARGGVAFLASHVGCTIIPVGISGAYGMSLSDFLFRRRTIIVRFGEPIYPEELDIAVRQDHDAESSENVYKREATYIMEKVKDMLGEE